MDDKTKMLIHESVQATLSRRAISAGLGMSFGGQRDLYETLGYPQDLKFDDYWNRFDRGDIAARIVAAPVVGCWSRPPLIIEDKKKDETAFEKAAKNLIVQYRIIEKMIQADILAGIGRYSVMLLGFAGSGPGGDLTNPVGKNAKLLYVRVYPESNAIIDKWEEDINNPRHGLPKIYKITFQLENGSAVKTKDIFVHYSRIIHICDGNLLDDVFGIPRLRNVYNRLLDIEKLSGGSAEMYWQGAYPGISFEADADADLTQNKDELTAEIDAYVHRLKRHMKLQGVKTNVLSPSVADPGPVLEVQLTLVSAATGIPKRILTGSERGELASTQDADNWNNRLEQRREAFCTNKMLRLFLDRLIEFGALIAPTTEYSITWPSLYVQSDAEKAEVAVKRAEALSKYVSGGLHDIITFEMFLTHICQYPEDVVEQIIESGPEEDLELGEDEEEEDWGNPKALEAGIIEGEVLAFSKCRHPTGVTEGGQFVSCDGVAGVTSTKAGWVDVKGTVLPQNYQEVLKNVPPSWTNVRVAVDLNSSPLVWGKDKAGREVRKTNPKIAATGQEAKWVRLEQMESAAPQIGRAAYTAMDEGGKKAGTGAAVYVAMKTGMRPGNKDDMKAKVQAYGVSTLEGRHVRVVDGSTVRFHFPGKAGVIQDHTVKGKALATYVKGRKAGKNDRVFNTTDDKMRGLIKRSSGNSDLMVKDLRTWRAATIARRTVATMPKPANSAEFKRSRNAVGARVAETLGNKPTEALKSYIPPSTFDSWRPVL